MSPRTVILYLVGHAGAIRQVAESRAALWTGMVLVLITAIPRNYDQSFVGDQPWRWAFGSLAFSLVSGTWIYAAAYGWLARRQLGKGGEVNLDFFSGWRSFMGLFWVTAPIAWLYGLPFERILDSVTATKANVGLLAVVSLWRVLLMARVFQALCGVHFLIGLIWVLFPALVETFGITFFSDAFGKRIMSGMAGIRNSPEEELVIAAVGTALTVSFWGAPLVLVMVLVIRPAGVRPFPTPLAGRVPVVGLVIAAAIWGAIAVLPQLQMARTSTAKRLIDDGDYRAAIDFLGALPRRDLPPDLFLPPKTFEWTTIHQVPGCIAVLTTNDQPWMRQLFLKKLDEMVSHTGRKYFQPRNPDDTGAIGQWLANGLGSSDAYASELHAMIDALRRLPEGRRWLDANMVFLLGVSSAAREEPMTRRLGSKPEAEQREDWRKLAARMDELLNELRNPPPAPTP